MKGKKNIWMIAKWYPNREDPQLGIFIRKHAKAISKYNKISVLYIHSTRYANATFEITVKNEDELNEVTVYYKRNASAIGKIINLVRYILAVRRGLNEINRTLPDPDLIHAYILTRPALLAWVISRGKNIPYVVSEQWSGFLTGKFLTARSLKQYVTRLVVKRAAAVSSVSNFLFKRMNECGLKNSNFHIIPNIIETPDSLVSEKANEFVYILMVADLVDEIKNISGVIRALSALNTDHNFRLYIVGRGPDENKLKNLAEDSGLLNRKIFFEGLKTNEEVYQYLMKCDFLVMNSRYETFSLICAEAMSCGKPVLATRCGGPNEFVNENTGILIEPGNNEQLISKLNFMLKNYQKFDAEFIRKYIKNLFSEGKVAEDFQNFYETAFKSKS